MEANISQLIEALWLNQNEFAIEIGTARTVVNQIVGGNRNIGMSILSRIKARWPNIDANWFFSPDIPIFLDSTKTPVAITQETKTCTRCNELELLVKDQQETISTLRKAIESNNILFDALRSQIKMK